MKQPLRQVMKKQRNECSIRPYPMPPTTTFFLSPLSDAAKLALQANAKQLYLTHISARYTEEEQRLMLEQQAQTIFPASKVVGDFDVFDI